ncbi:MAG: hypothetical protein J6S70_00095, partial [Clostridia bacterium]|nr:hypothetical protein [Clostridia bacterium]
MLPRLKIDTHYYDDAIRRAAEAFGEEPLFGFRFDLDRDNVPCAGYGYANAEKVCVCRGEDVFTAETARMDDIEYVQYIGCAAIEYTFDGERYELCRSDMKNAVALQNTVKRLRSLREGKDIGHISENEDETACPVCGTP